MQSVTFVNAVEITVNFAESTSFTNAQTQLPAQTLEVRWKDAARLFMRFEAVKSGVESDGPPKTCKLLGVLGSDAGSQRNFFQK